MGTYWHTKDPRDPTNPTGLTPAASGMIANISALIKHISLGVTNSPYVSLTTSYPVAESYAIYAGKARPSPTTPGYVYEITLPDILPPPLQLQDPVQEIAANVKPPLQSSYQHTGPQEFLLGVVTPWIPVLRSLLFAPVPQPPGSTATPRAPHLSDEVETLTRALRDAEVLALGTISSTFITKRWSVS